MLNLRPTRANNSEIITLKFSNFQIFSLVNIWYVIVVCQAKLLCINFKLRSKIGQNAKIFLHPHNFAPQQSFLGLNLASWTKDELKTDSIKDIEILSRSLMIVLARCNDDCCGRVPHLKPPWTHFNAVYHVAYIWCHLYRVASIFQMIWWNCVNRKSLHHLALGRCLQVDLLPLEVPD